VAASQQVPLRKPKVAAEKPSGNRLAVSCWIYSGSRAAIPVSLRHPAGGDVSKDSRCEAAPSRVTISRPLKRTRNRTSRSGRRRNLARNKSRMVIGSKPAWSRRSQTAQSSEPASGAVHCFRCSALGIPNLLQNGGDGLNRLLPIGGPSPARRRRSHSGNDGRSERTSVAAPQKDMLCRGCASAGS
jgi:hypothetical protein